MNETKNMACDVATTAQTENIKIEKIRVRKGIEVEVNDNGDTIMLLVEDMQFMDGFYGIIDKFTQAAERISGIETENTKEQLQLLIKECKNLTQEIDLVFGEECCKKVFGNIVPTPYAMTDFFDQLTPILGRYANERQSKIGQKYNKYRQGTKKKQYYHKKRK